MIRSATPSRLEGERILDVRLTFLRRIRELPEVLNFGKRSESHLSRLDFRHLRPDTYDPTPDYAHRTSHIAHRTSHIARRTSHIEHRTSHIAHRTSNIRHRTSALSKKYFMKGRILLDRYSLFNYIDVVPERPCALKRRTHRVSTMS